MTAREGSYRHYVIGSPLPLVVVTLIMGGSGMVLAHFVPNPYTKVYPPLLIIGGILAGVVTYRGVSGQTFPVQSELTTPTRRILLSAYLFLFSATVLTWALSDSVLRPLSVHALLALLQLLTAVLIFALRSSRVALTAVIASGLLHRALAYYASTVQIGFDSLFHNRVSAQIAATWSLEPLAFSKYWYAPLYHVVTAATTAALNVSVRDAAFLTTTVGTTVVSAVAIYALLRRAWDPKTAVLASFLYLTADHVIGSSVVVGPTSLAVLLFLAVLITVDPFLDGDRRYPWKFTAALLLLMFTHQLSLFITVVGVGAYIAGRTFWQASVGWREATLVTLLNVAFLFQSSITRYGGPRGGERTFIEATGASLLVQLQTLGERGSQMLPGTVDVAVSGADALSPMQVLGSAILFSLAVVGVVYWLDVRPRPGQRTAVGYGTMVTVMCVFVFVPPVLGMNFFIPGRWFRFLYVPLALLAAPGLTALVVMVSRRPRFTARFVVALLVVTAPYVAFMSMNYRGAADGPVIDDAPEASRQSVTQTERDAYLFVTNSGGGTVAVADHHARQVIERHFGYPATIYRNRYGTTQPAEKDPHLYLYRAYAQTDHASYVLVYRDSRFRVYGPLPPPDHGDSVVYTNGDDVVVYR